MAEENHPVELTQQEQEEVEKLFESFAVRDHETDQTAEDPESGPPVEDHSPAPEEKKRSKKLSFGSALSMLS